MKRVVRKSKIDLDSPKKLPIVKLSDEKTSREGAGNTATGLTGHADVNSMAAESYSNLALSSRQLLPPAPARWQAVDDSLRSRQVEYVPPADDEIARFAFEVCRTLAERIPSAGFASTEMRQGFQQFLTVVARIVASQANQRGAQWKTESEPEPPSHGQ